MPVDIRGLTGSQQGEYSIREYTGFNKKSGSLEARVYVDSLQRGLVEDAEGDDNDPLSQLISQEEEEEAIKKVEDDKVQKEVVQNILDGNDKTWLKMAREQGIESTHYAYALRDKLRKKFRHLVRDGRPKIEGKRVLLYVYGRMKRLGRDIYEEWDRDDMLKEFKKPTKSMIEDYVEDVLLGVGGGRVVYRSPQRRYQLYPTEGQLGLF